MQSSTPRDVGRRVIVGQDSQGRSCVLHDDVSQARTVRPNGAVVQEVWRQEGLPAHVDEDGTREGEMIPMPPPQGASIRLFTLPADGQADPEVPASVFGQENAGDSSSPTLHRTASLYVATVMSGQAYLVLETTEVLLRQGDSLVLPGSTHTWRNPFPEAALMVSTVFYLAE
jgi:mannose-6-phosphate isomerase-like protein (cupin superfamily)